MKSSWISRSLLALVAAGAATMAGCENGARTEPAPSEPAAAPAPALKPTQMAFPTGDPRTSAVLLEKIYPSEVQVGQAFDYTIRVTNLTSNDLDTVIVEDSLPEGFRVSSSSPEGQKVGAALTRWNLGTIPARQTREIRVSGTAGAVGTLNACATVSYSSALCSTINVTKPDLRLTKAAPAEVTVCDAIPVKITVTNTGTGVARNVTITDPLPAGLTTSDGRNALSFTVPSLNPGQSREFTATLKASKTGKYENKASAKADGGLAAESNVTSTTVRQPVLAIDKVCPDRLFIGRPITYEITVTNKGDAVARNTVVEDTLPAGATFASATDGGTAAGSKVTWRLGDLAPNASRKVSVTFNAATIGTLRGTAQARAECAAAVEDACETALAGIPAILLEVVDVTDPVRVGTETTYVITATNQGSATGTNIKIVATLEDNMQFVSSSGDTGGAFAGASVTFAPLPSLAPGARATWRVTVRAAKEGDTRFSVKMTSDQLGRSVDETEATNFYR